MRTRHLIDSTKGSSRMDLKSGYPYWAIKNGLMHAFPSVNADQQCDVAIVGGGISAALIANELAQHGHDVIVLEQRDIAWGSTSASTALLQYEIDTPMVDLAKRYGEKDAALAYRACADAIAHLHALARDLRGVDFALSRSLYYASRKRDVSAMREEFALRQRHGFDMRWLDTNELWESFGVRAPGAILSKLAAHVDPYRLAYRLLSRLERNGARVFDRTRVAAMQTSARKVVLGTESGYSVTASHVVLAAGYANEHWLSRKVAKNRSSYAFITDPLDATMLGALSKTMVWESARPYIYLRSTSDSRLLVGGEDDAVDIPAKRDARVDAKARRLVEKVALAIPSLQLQPAFAWAGTFAETEDGLPYFGPHPQHGPRVHFAMAYGGNGISYSAIGAGLIRASIERRKHPLKTLFSFSRLDRD